MAKWTRLLDVCNRLYFHTSISPPVKWNKNKSGVLCIIMLVCLFTHSLPVTMGMKGLKRGLRLEGCLNVDYCSGKEGHEKLVVKDHDLCTSRWGMGERLPWACPYKGVALHPQPPPSPPHTTWILLLKLHLFLRILFLPAFISLLCFIAMLCIPKPMSISLEQNTVGF